MNKLKCINACSAYINSKIVHLPLNFEMEATASPVVVVCKVVVITAGSEEVNTNNKM